MSGLEPVSQIFVMWYLCTPFHPLHAMLSPRQHSLAPRHLRDLGGGLLVSALL